MGIGKRIKEAREMRGWTQKELADMIDVTASAVTNYENNTSHPKENVMYALINALKVEPNFLFQDEMKNKKTATIIDFAEQTHLAKYRRLQSPGKRAIDLTIDSLLAVQDSGANEVIRVGFRQSEQKVCAGTGIYLDEERMETISVRLDALPKGYERDPSRYYGVQVAGDSMEPLYHDGDTLIVSKEPLDVGEIGVVVMDGEGYVKQIGNGVLKSLNPDYADIPINESIHFQGKVIGVLDRAALN